MRNGMWRPATNSGSRPSSLNSTFSTIVGSRIRSKAPASHRRSRSRSLSGRIRRRWRQPSAPPANGPIRANSGPALRGRDALNLRRDFESVDREMSRCRGRQLANGVDASLPSPWRNDAVGSEGDPGLLAPSRTTMPGSRCLVSAVHHRLELMATGRHGRRSDGIGAVADAATTGDIVADSVQCVRSSLELLDEIDLRLARGSELLGEDRSFASATSTRGDTSEVGADGRSA